MVIKLIPLRDWVVSLRHILCDDNNEIDFLAKKGALSNDISLVIWHEAPS